MTLQRILGKYIQEMFKSFNVEMNSKYADFVYSSTKRKFEIGTRFNVTSNL
jgi:hypothetical protein